MNLLQVLIQCLEKNFGKCSNVCSKRGSPFWFSTPYMDEAALCDRIALIQDGKILDVDTPHELVDHYPKALYNVRAENMYKLIQKLKDYQHHYSVFPFGEFVHYTDQRTDFNTDELQNYLEGCGLENIAIEPTSLR